MLRYRSHNFSPKHTSYGHHLRPKGHPDQAIHWDKPLLAPVNRPPTYHIAYKLPREARLDVRVTSRKIVGNRSWIGENDRSHAKGSRNLEGGSIFLYPGFKYCARVAIKNLLAHSKEPILARWSVESRRTSASACNLP